MWDHNAHQRNKPIKNGFQDKIVNKNKNLKGKGLSKNY